MPHVRESIGAQQLKGRRIALAIKGFMERAAEAKTASVVSLERSAVMKLALCILQAHFISHLGYRYVCVHAKTADGATWPYRSSFGGTAMFPGLNLAKASFTYEIEGGG